MSTWMDKKAQLRRIVQKTFCREALYLLNGAPTRRVSVRVHQDVSRYGDLQGDGYAEAVDTVTLVIFLADQVATPAMGAVVQMIDTGERFQVEVVEPPEGPVERVAYVRKLAA